MHASGLVPRWASAPGETIASVLSQRNMTRRDLANHLRLSPPDLEQLLVGGKPITLSIARGLSAVLGGSTGYWIAREAQYLDDLARVEADRWSQGFPIKQMASFGWIELPKTWQEQIATCLDFFGAEDVASWEMRYRRQLEDAHFRSSPSFPLEAPATTAWFRACERSANEIPSLATFSPEDFERALSDIRNLTRVREAAKFVPALVQQCAAVGVALVVVPAPKGCPASGTARLYQGTPLIQLSARHLSDDHLWFTFFHEAGHVLRHVLDAPFVDMLDGEEDDLYEVEANEFAFAWLTGRDPGDRGIRSRRDAIRLAHANGVSPGIIVGQLQHSGRLPRDQMNDLKRRYVWKGSSLETRQRR